MSPWPSGCRWSPPASASAHTFERLRLSEHVAASASVTRNVIDLPQGTFAANVWNETRLPGDARRALLLKYTHLIAF